MSSSDADQPESVPKQRIAAFQGELSLFAPPATRDEILAPARMVNEWVYCPRLAVLEWARGEWAGNADTSAGRRTHKATERGPAPALPAADVLPDDKAL